MKVGQLRAILEDHHDPQHFRKLHNLKSEWPDLWEAILSVAYPNGKESDPTYPYGEKDATKWADEFMRLLGDGTLRFSRDTMVGWFANAIETGQVLGIKETHDDSRDFYLSFIDNAIDNWRRIYSGEVEIEGDVREMAPYYIDAFQSIRLSLFGETLPVDDEE